MDGILRRFNALMDEHDQAGAGGGTTADAGSQPDKQQAPEGSQDPNNGASGSTPQDGLEITWNGQKKKVSREEAIKLAQQGYNVTQKEQMLSRKSKELQDKMQRLDALIAEAEKNGDDPSGDNEIKKLSNELKSYRDEIGEIKLQRAMEPIKSKFPDIDEDQLLIAFEKKVSSGEVEDNENGLMSVAENLAKGYGEKVSSQLEKLLSDPENPKMKAFADKVIREYIEGKRKLANAGGETGGPSGGPKPQKIESISEAASRARQM